MALIHIIVAKTLSYLPTAVFDHLYVIASNIPLPSLVKSVSDMLCDPELPVTLQLNHVLSGATTSYWEAQKLKSFLFLGQLCTLAECFPVNLRLPQSHPTQQSGPGV
ncbi:hypothetical protein PILCRDRAFT_4121 [Piloderma croceum F 1598]|uniref:Uncharacterized protein n=1 Tax=Piloderma croceum (strain F 1598) TaxID=765440 RepID=A0A0C3FS41_PILCF|nr:hypothetical protein PILCRDRAFT_4121 [Piloderma croceum F 1598]